MNKITYKWMGALLIVAAVAMLGAFFPFGSDSQEVDFNAEIRPILNGKCISCHGGVKQNGGLSLLNEAQAFAPGESGVPAIIPGDPAGSELIRRVVHTDLEERMPLDGDPLQEAEINLLNNWIRSGAKWDMHWAWVQPDAALSPPAVRSDWGYNGIDNFVWQKLREAGMKPAPEADRATLIRRTSIDLIGLPPTEEEVARFVADEAPDAYERMVDHLLESPHFGERWASMWMDLARYGDSQGYQKDPRRNIWAYRDWLISAFNADMPFDQFTIEQLAGDLVENPTNSQLIATAFHRNTMSNDEGGTDDEEFRVAAVIDRISTTFEIWQGVTIGCVQCHDHPYDPFPHEDYYQLMAFFNNTKDADRTDEFPTLRAYSPLQQQELEELTAWISQYDPRVELAQEMDPEEKQKRAEPAVIPASAADYLNNLEFCEVEQTKVACYIKDGSFLAFENLDFSKIGSISPAYVSGGGGGTLEIHIDEIGRTPFATVPLIRTGQWARKAKGNWKFETVNVERLEGKHTLLLVFRGVADVGICDFKGFAINPRELNGSQELARELAAKRDRLRELKPAKTPILLELSPDSSRQTFVFERGNWLVHGEEVHPETPALLGQLPTGAPRNRMGLARWLVSGSNPLTGRVIVNRFWEQLFGSGLVLTLEDFGTQGEKPTHPELLDWLALQFSGPQQWSMKALLKHMVLSATYRQTAEVSPEYYQIDPANRMLARGARFRMTAEQIRDQALAVSGLLSEKMYGPSVMPAQPEGTWQVIRGVLRWEPSKGEDRYRRSLYTFWRKSSPYPSMITFDTPSREYCVSRRIRTNTPLQALVALNDSMFVEAAQAFAARMVKEGGETHVEQLRHGYRLAMAREIDPADFARLEAFYLRTLAWYQERPEETCEVVGKYPESPDMAAMINTANVMMNLDEFITKP